MKRLKLLLFICLISQFVKAQGAPSPYEKWDWKRDGIWTGAALGGTAYGLSLIVNKKGISESQLETLVANQNNINFMDKWVAGNYSVSAGKISDVPFYLSFAAPLVLFFDDEVNDNGGQVMGLFLESMATTGAIYGITVGLAKRSRPYVYSDEATLNRRLKNNGQRSFFSGHTAATATSTFFVAKVYQDFNPNSPGIPYVWAGAITLPMVVGYFRMEAGQHFLSDVLVGYGIGALVGYYIPELHKKGRNSIQLKPTVGRDFFGENYQALSLSFQF